MSQSSRPESSKYKTVKNNKKLINILILYTVLPKIYKASILNKLNIRYEKITRMTLTIAVTGIIG